jgi:hypothetical protein
MDTTRDSKQKKKENAHGSEKPSQDNTFDADMPADLIDMPEFDENDPDMKAWMDGELERQRKFFAGTTHEEAMAAVDKIIAENGGTLEPKP